MNTKGKNYLLCISVLSVFAFGNCMGAVDGALSKIADALNVEHTLALYVGSIPALTSMASSLLLGVIAGKKLPYKITSVFCAALMIAAGVIPVLAENFATILITRCFFGLGLGGMMSLQNPIATKLIPVESRASVLGIGTCVAFTFQCILQLVGGVLADVQWNLVFLTHLILLIPLAVMIIFLPKMELDAPEEKQQEKAKLPKAALLMCGVIGIVTLNLAPLLFGSAFYVAAISDSATVAAVIAMLFSIGCMTGGLVYPQFYKRLKAKSFSAFLGHRRGRPGDQRLSALDSGFGRRLLYRRHQLCQHAGWPDDAARPDLRAGAGRLRFRADDGICKSGRFPLLQLGNGHRDHHRRFTVRASLCRRGDLCRSGSDPVHQISVPEGEPAVLT